MIRCSGNAKRFWPGSLLRLEWIAAAVLWVAGCAPVPKDVLTAPDGTQIRRDAIQTVVDDTTLTDAEKQQALRDLGITDELLISALISGGA